jgi:outer membrane protein assembly factor BamB
MKKPINKTIYPIVLVLILALSTLAATIPMASAADIPTYTFLTVNPNPIGESQTAVVAFWLDKVTPTASTLFGDRWEGLMLTITKPDGSIETKGPYTLDAVATGYDMYTPTAAGKYYFEVSFPGQDITNRNVTTHYQASKSAKVELVVQQEQIGFWEDLPLPTGYWTRPLNAELRYVNTIASHWLAAGATGPHGPRAYGSQGNYQPYGAAPDSAHILWTREIAFGGAVGGEHGDNVFYPGETYERKFQPAIIMNGRLYYNMKLGSGANLWDGAYCVDMNTGETIWYINSTNKNSQFLTFGQLLSIDTPNQHGVIPYLWSVQGSTYKMYDAFTGDWILDLTGVPSGSMVNGKNGEFLIYTLNAAGNYMTMWNSTKAIYPLIDTNWRWMISPTTPNVTAGYQWNVTLTDVPGNQGITKINNEVIYARATHQSTPTTIVTDVAYDIKDGKEPVQLFVQNRTFDGSIMNGPMDSGVFTTFIKEKMVWYGFDVKTGAQKWGPTAPYENAWGMYQPYADAVAGAGKLVAGGYDGIVHCFNIVTGDNLWNYNTGSAGFETPYGTYPFKDNALTIADGKVYAATNEHSPSTPFFHGWRLHSINLETGAPVWNISFIGLAPLIADGRAVSVNYFDNRIYCFGTGPSATTVQVAPKVVSAGNGVMIEGTVTDQSPGAKGTPAISDANQIEWMEYLYEQRPMPIGATGVQVKLSAIDSDGHETDIGTVTSDAAGMFKRLWTPQTAGEYTIIASFEGTASYGSSYAQTALGVTVASAEPTTQPTQSPTQAPTDGPTQTPSQTTTPASPTPAVEPDADNPTETLLIVGAAVVIIAVIGAAALVLRKRK